MVSKQLLLAHLTAITAHVEARRIGLFQVPEEGQKWQIGVNQLKRERGVDSWMWGTVTI